MLTAQQLDAFTSGRLYVNVHTPANNLGEIRGQVAPPPIEVLFTVITSYSIHYTKLYEIHWRAKSMVVCGSGGPPSGICPPTEAVPSSLRTR